MKLYLITSLLLSLSCRYALAANMESEDSSLLASQQQERKYCFQTYEPNLWHGFIKSVGLKAPIYRVIHQDADVEGRPFLQDVTQKFTKSRILDKQQVINFFKNKEFSIIIGQDEVVIGKTKPCDLSKFVAQTIFVGTINISHDKYIHLTDLSENEPDLGYLKMAFHAIKDFFAGFDVVVHNGDTTITVTDIID